MMEDEGSCEDDVGGSCDNDDDGSYHNVNIFIIPGVNSHASAA